MERFNRTLKEKMWRYLTYKNTERWVDVLPQLIKGYNLTHHRIIGRAPASVNAENAMDVCQHLYGKQEMNIGGNPSVSVTKSAFPK